MDKIISSFRSVASAWRSRFSSAGMVGKLLIGCSTLAIFMCICSLPMILLSPSKEEAPVSSRSQEVAVVEQEPQLSQQIALVQPSATTPPAETDTPQPTQTAAPTATDSPTETPLPTKTARPTATHTSVPSTNTPLPTRQAPTTLPPTQAPPTADSPTQAPPTAEAPTQVSPTDMPPTEPPPPTSAPPPTEGPAAEEPPPVITTIAQLVIAAVDKRSEFVDIRNDGSAPIDLGGWRLVSEKGNQSCSLGGTIQPGQSLRIWAMAQDAAQGGFNCQFGDNIWNNSDPDPAVLYDPNGNEVFRR